MRRRAVDYSLYLITDRQRCRALGLRETVAAAVSGGVSAVQLRDPQATGRELTELGRALRTELASDGDVTLFVDDRLDVALAIGADGVHLGQDDLPATAARAIAGPGLVIGLSVRSLAEAEQAARLDAGCVDYLGVGPVFATGSKPDAAPPMGVAALAEIVATSTVPCVAIGGITLANAAEVAATGVAGLAVISAICGTADPAASARTLAAAVRRARRPDAG